MNFKTGTLAMLYIVKVLTAFAASDPDFHGLTADEEATLLAWTIAAMERDNGRLPIISIVSSEKVYTYNPFAKDAQK